MFQVAVEPSMVAFFRGKKELLDGENPFIYHDMSCFMCWKNNVLFCLSRGPSPAHKRRLARAIVFKPGSKQEGDSL